MPRDNSKTTAKTNSAANAKANAKPAPKSAPKKSATSSTASRLAREGAKDLGQAEDTILAARDVEAARRAALAEGASDLARAEDYERVAGKVGQLSEIVSAAGARDVAQGAAMLAASEDLEAMSALVAVMGAEDLEHGMALARLSGELRAAYAIVRRLRMPVLAGFLSDRSERLNFMAVDAVLRASGTRALGTALAATGNFSEARTHMNLALSQGTQDARLYFHAAVIAARAEKFDEAKDFLAKAFASQSQLLPSELAQLRSAEAMLPSSPLSLVAPTSIALP